MLKKLSKKQKVLGTLILVVVVIAAAFFAYKTHQHTEYLQSKIINGLFDDYAFYSPYDEDSRDDYVEFFNEGIRKSSIRKALAQTVSNQTEVALLNTTYYDTSKEDRHGMSTTEDQFGEEPTLSSLRSSLPEVIGALTELGYEDESLRDNLYQFYVQDRQYEIDHASEETDPIVREYRLATAMDAGMEAIDEFNQVAGDLIELVDRLHTGVHGGRQTVFAHDRVGFLGCVVDLILPVLHIELIQVVPQGFVLIAQFGERADDLRQAGTQAGQRRFLAKLVLGRAHPMSVLFAGVVIGRVEQRDLGLIADRLGQCFADRAFADALVEKFDIIVAGILVVRGIERIIVKQAVYNFALEIFRVLMRLIGEKRCGNHHDHQNQGPKHFLLFGQFFQHGGCPPFRERMEKVSTLTVNPAGKKSRLV